MKTFAICVLVLAVAALFVPAAQAGTKCYHLTNFCDGLEATTSTGSDGALVAGLWDWQCLANNTGTIVVGVPNKFGGLPTNPPYNTGSGAGFGAMFVFKPATHTFDLLETDGFTYFAIQVNQPFTTKAGVCNPLHANTGMRTATGR
jgi:hypothetical protein